MKSLDLSGSHLASSLDAQFAEIEGNVFLKNFQADGTVSLYGATIGGNLDCQKGTFDNPKGYALNAYRAEIKSTVDLSNGFNAKGKVSLERATIGGNLDCKNGTFDNPKGYALNADDAEIKGNVYLKKFKAVEIVRFVHTIIDNSLQLEEVDDNCDMILDLSFARISRLIADKQKNGWPQPGKLVLNGLVYESINLDSSTKKNESTDPHLNWLRLQFPEEKKSNNFFPQPYEQLARVLNESGYESAATEVLIGKQEDRRKYGRLSRLSKFLNWLLGFTIGHGYEPLKALGFALGFVVLGTALFHLGYSEDSSLSLITPSDVDKAGLSSPSQSEDKEVSEDYPKFNPLVYSLDVFIPIMNLHQQSYWLPNANRGEEIPLILFKRKTGSLLRWYFWAHIVFGWILTSLWVAGFTGLVRSAE